MKEITKKELLKAMYEIWGDTYQTSSYFIQRDGEVLITNYLVYAFALKEICQHFNMDDFEIRINWFNRLWLSFADVHYLINVEIEE